MRRLDIERLCPRPDMNHVVLEVDAFPGRAYLSDSRRPSIHGDPSESGACQVPSECAEYLGKRFPTPESSRNKPRLRMENLF